MKAILELSKIPVKYERWVTNEWAEEYYVGCGFRGVMNFEDWCRKEHLTIIGSEEV